MQFEWNRKKAGRNRVKHGVEFEEAQTVFGDLLAVVFDDEAHSADEHREVIIGHSLGNRLLLVSFSQPDGDTIRIISARIASRRERSGYENARRD
jgi:uncharacterized DUF497 family protein